VLVRTVRSGVTEATDEVTVLACDRSGTVLLRSGDPDEPLFYRSAIKPFQAVAALEAGVSLPPEHLALACASHGGHPVHLAIVSAILEAGGLEESALRCPAAWPLSAAARDLQIRRGVRRPRRIFHNCSGKHATMLRACIASGWPTGGYLDPDHPLQRGILHVVAEATGVDPRPVGVDGCGAPTLRGTVRGQARGFAHLSDDERFAAVASATSRFPALVADDRRPDGRLGSWWGGPVKVGAVGLIGAGRHGIGIAAKSRSGSSRNAVAALVAAARRLGLLSQAMVDGLEDVAEPPVLGGGRHVGSLVVEG